MKLFRLMFIALTLILLTNHAKALDENTSVACIVTNVTDNGQFEKKHGFTFEQHPHIHYSVDAAKNQKFTVGELNFETADKSKPAKIDYSDDLLVVMVEASWIGQSETYILAHTGQYGVFSYDGHMVAEIDCTQDP